MRKASAVIYLLALTFNSIATQALAQVSDQDWTVEGYSHTITGNDGKVYIDRVLVPDDEHKFNIKKSKSTGFSLQFANGGEVALGIRDRNPQILKIPLQIESSMCGKKTPAKKCFLQTTVKEDEIRLYWKKHANPTFQGQEAINFYGEIPLEEDILWDFSQRNFYPEKVKQLGDSHFYCEDYAWFDNANVPPKSIVLREWANELMLQNDETNLSENQGFMGYLNVRFNLGPEGKYVLSGFDQVFSKFGSLVLAAFGDVIGWTVEKDNQLCDVAFKPDPQVIQKVASQFDDQSFPLTPFSEEKYPETEARIEGSSFTIITGSDEINRSEEIKGLSEYGLLQHSGQRNEGDTQINDYKLNLKLDPEMGESK